jgi:hypothetical protein
MNEMQVLFIFCVFYSGAMSVVLWANLLSRKRLEAHLKHEQFPDRFDRGA